MPFDPTLPAFGSPDSSAEMRAQLNGLKDLINAIPDGPPGPPGEVETAALDGAISGTARNPSGVFPLSITISDPPTQTGKRYAEHP